jgi:hypothetical protein
MGELVACGFEDDRARFLVRALLWPATTAPGLFRDAGAFARPVSLHVAHASPSKLSCHRAMLLHDDCHPIDYPNMRSILENVKFPNYSLGLTETNFR